MTETPEQTDNRFNADFLSDIKVFSRFGPLISGGLRVVCAALILPIILYTIASQMVPAYELATIKGSLHRSLMLLLPFVFVAVLLLKTTRPQGLAERHFGMGSDVVQQPVSLAVVRCVVVDADEILLLCAGDVCGRTVSGFVGESGLRRRHDRRYRRIDDVHPSCEVNGGIRKLKAMGLNHTATQRRQSRENLLNGGPVNVDHLIADPWTRPLPSDGIVDRAGGQRNADVPLAVGIPFYRDRDELASDVDPSSDSC